MSIEAWTAVQGVATSLSVVAAAIAVWASYKIHRESGPLINVKLTAFGYQPALEGSGQVSIEDGKFELPLADRAQLELAKFTIQNSGRTPATVKSFYLNFGGTKKGQYSETPLLYEHLPSGKIEPFFNGQLTVDPFGERTLIVDFWPVVRRTFKEDQELQQISVLAEVYVAGVSKPVTSKKSAAWKIRRQYVSMVADRRRVTPKDILASEIARCFEDLLAPAWMRSEIHKACSLSGPDYKFEDIHSFMQPLYRSPRGPMTRDDASPTLMTALLRASSTMNDLGDALIRSKAPTKAMLREMGRVHGDSAG